MSSGRIAVYINLMIGRDKMNITVSKETVCRILKKEYGKPRKSKKFFSKPKAKR